MSEFRTTDLEYGEEYWSTLDGGAGYQDSIMWVNISCAVKDILGIDWDAKRDITPEVNLLDIGCAHGYSVKWLRRQGFDAWGVDYSQYAIDHADPEVKTYLKQYDLTGPYGWYFGDESFQAITCFETMEHIPEENVNISLERIFSVLKPNGKGIFTICTSAQPGWESDPTHVTIKTRDWWQGRLRKAGFIINNDEVNQLRKYWLFSQHDGVFVVQK